MTRDRSGSNWIDANCMIGPRAKRQPSSPADAVETLNELQRCGISHALVYHSLARESSPELGNSTLASILHSQPHLYGCWVALPGSTSETGPAETFATRLLDSGNVAARLFPDVAAHRFELSNPMLDPLLEGLQAHRVPTFIDTQTPNWQALDHVLTRFPTLPVVLTNFGYRWQRDLYALLARHAQLYVETATFVTHGAVEDVSDRFGSERLLFGSNLPMYSAGGAIARIALASISEEDKRNIAWANLQKLIKGVKR